MAFSSLPAVTAGVTATKATWGNQVKTNEDDHENRLLAVEGSSRLVLASDPSSPVDSQWWFLTDGGSPETITLRVRRGSTTYSLPIGTLA